MPERMQPHEVFPELDELRALLPPNGIGFHGTSETNANSILRRKKMFAMKNAKGNPQEFYFHHISKQGGRNHLEAYRQFYDALRFAHIASGPTTWKDRTGRVLLLFLPDLSVSNEYDSVAAREVLYSGGPVSMITEKPEKFKPVGISRFVWDVTSGVRIFQVRDTLQGMINSLNGAQEKGLLTPLTPQSPDQG